MSLAASAPVASTKQTVADIPRPCVKFPPSIWGDAFLQYDSQSLEVDDNMKQQMQMQMQNEEVKKMFLSSSNNNILQKLNFIDSLQRLGVSYHFQHEIDKSLKQIHNTFTNDNSIEEESCLHCLALLFRLLRQGGYHISSEIFNKFKNNQGNFNEKVAKDVQGMWNLFEAAQLRGHGEDILDEALDFTYIHLKSLINQLSPSLAAQVSHCLSKPLHKEIPRLKARRYMPFYEDDPSHSKALLNFAKLDFNLQQKLHQKEVCNITMWWKRSDFGTKVPYARNRVVEAYFWPLAMSYEPEYSVARTIVGKLVGCISLLDDTYDAYGTVEELEVFTQAIQRWDISFIQSLPECMKVVFSAIVELWDEIELVTAEGGKSSIVLNCIKEAFSDLAKAYFVEAKWCHEGYIPTYDEYKVNGAVSSTCPLQIVAFLLLGKFSTQEVIDWILSYPKIIKAVSVIGRFEDDLSSHKFEQQRVHVASAVECCMKQYEISQEEASKLIRKDIEDLWKVINEECLESNHIPRPVLECILNLGRVTEFTYDNFMDKYTNAELLKVHVVDPISIEQHD
ncbi:probable terpene synthase 2 [Abrus precatorius]|uniref:Probable terpene synthase 2 n=1 Tax=Abrus precatorius TaxID=3816 RepID=A0A8B8KEA0_ABRPR|nr:probable terpene synthase 2 [Abrus precatorius]